MPLNREWKVRPSRVAPDTGVQSWEVEAPDGTVTNCVTDLARKLTKQSKGILLAYASAGRVWATEDYQVH
jgi:hypothetical protein